MSFEDTLRNNQNTANNLVGQVETSPVLKKNSHKHVMRQIPTRVYTQDISGEGVWGIGFGNGTDNDGDWGDVGYTWQGKCNGSFCAPKTLSKINSYKREFREGFWVSAWEEVFLTASWVGDYKLKMSADSSHSKMYNTIARFPVHVNNENINKATITCNEYVWGNDQIVYALSDDGGTTWVPAQLGQTISFDGSGDELYISIIFIGNGGKDTYIKDLKVNTEV